MFSGPRITQDGLLRVFDASSRRSTLRNTQSSNILPDPNNWIVGTGGQSGYSSNGSSSEQNRLVVTDDPWGRTSITWRTTPDSTSGADGGWNSSYYSIDNTFTYRYSMWVRRYTSGTGGTFYMGMNPNPIRNDNNASQSNPYFTYPSISSLTQNQWYLVVAHVFYTGYTGGRHPDSGWYENGTKISDKSFGNVGSSDVRWDPTTTSARHRAYHYYTTNTASGIEFAFPRVDKCDGTEPSINELINIGESGWVDVKNSAEANLLNGINHVNDGQKSYFNLDGTDEEIIIPTFTYSPKHISVWLYNNNTIPGNDTAIGGPSTYQTLFSFGGGTAGVNLGGWTGGATNEAVHIWSTSGSTRLTYTNQAVPIGVHNFVFNWNGSRYDIWIDGVKQSVLAGGAGHASLVSYTDTIYLGSDGNTYNFNGRIYSFNISDESRTDSQVLSDYNATKGRFI